MTPHQVVRVMGMGETAGRGDAYKLGDNPYPAGSRKAMLWAAGFAAGHGDRDRPRAERPGFPRETR